MICRCVLFWVNLFLSSLMCWLVIVSLLVGFMVFCWCWVIVWLRFRLWIFRSIWVDFWVVCLVLSSLIWKVCCWSCKILLFIMVWIFRVCMFWLLLYFRWVFGKCCLVSLGLMVCLRWKWIMWLVRFCSFIVVMVCLWVRLLVWLCLFVWFWWWMIKWLVLLWICSRK